MDLAVSEVHLMHVKIRKCWEIFVCAVYTVATLVMLQISTNGLVSFGESFDLQNLESFPRRTPPYVPVIAPFWADFNFRDSGAIFYRVTQDPAVLNSAEHKIATPGFSPTLAVVITWFQGELQRNSGSVVCGIVWVQDSVLTNFMARISSHLNHGIPISEGTHYVPYNYGTILLHISYDVEIFSPSVRS